MKKRTQWLVALLLVVQVVAAQDAITSRCNYPRHADRLVKQQLAAIDPGMNGDKLVWNFRNAKPINDQYKLNYYYRTTGDSSLILAMEQDSRFYSQLKGDTLWNTGYENRTAKMSYHLPEAQLRYPFTYGDSLTTRFEGEGSYCDRIDLKAKGQTTVTADARGILINPEGDTLKRVIRIKRIRTLTEIGKDSVQMKLENYLWYARGYRYPVFETVKTLVIRPDSTSTQFQASYFYSVREMQKLAEDNVNENIRKDDAQQEAVVRNCKVSPNPVRNQMRVSYELSQEAQVAYRLCDVSGVAFADIPVQKLEAGKQQQPIDMNGLHPGEYVLYITVDEKVIRCKVVKL